MSITASNLLSSKPALVASAVIFAALASTGAHAQFGGQQPFAGQQFAPQAQQQQPGAIEQFRQTLGQFGSFVNHPRYGEVWVPNPQVTGAGWRPYPQCHWSYDRQQQAWMFNDQTPWGQIVHHYGRWANDPSVGGWLWVADANYGPGWVHWQNNASQVSWAAMGPDQDGGQPAQDAWQTQDAQTFNAGCRQQAPAPLAQQQPRFAPQGPIFAPSGPRFVPIAPASFGPGRPPIIVIPGGPRPGLCFRFPQHPFCRGPGTFNVCNLRLPPNRLPPHCRGSAQVPLHCRGILGPGNDPRCRLNPGGLDASCRGPNRHPSCAIAIGPGSRFCLSNPGHPRCTILIGNRLQANNRFPGVRPFPGRPNLVRPFPGRPNLVRPFPNRPNLVRPFPNRPAIARPFPNRPSLARPNLGRPAMGPHFGRAVMGRMARR